jgi:hypothetical protein
MPPTVKFEFDKDDAAQLVNDEPLGSAALDVTPAGLMLKQGFSIAGAEVVLSASSNLTVQAFNSLDDKDVDGVLLPAAGKGAPPPMVTLKANAAWLKYRFDANLKAAVKASLGAAGFNIDGSAGGVLADYRFHPVRTQTVRAGFLADVAAGPRTVFDLSAVESLQAGDAVTLQTRGAIDAKVTLSFADLFTTQATALLALGGVQKAIAFKVTAGATATFDVRISDEFVVSFAGVAANTWRIGVRKAKTRKVGAGVAASFEVGAADPKELNAFLKDIKDALIGQPLEKVKDLLSKATLDSLTDAQRTIVEALLERFGLSGTLDAVNELKKRIDAIDKGLADVLQEVAKTKVTIGFAYEYARVSEDTELLQMTVDRPHLRTLHGRVVRGDLKAAIAALAGGEAGVSLEHYLNQSTLTRTRSWGFTLGIGKWVTVGGKDTDTLKVVTRRNLEGRAQESYLGTRSYQGRWQGDKFEWSADFRADMRAYSQNAMPTLPEFDLGLHLALAGSHGKLSSTDIDEYLDFAACWGIVGDDIAERQAQMLDAKGTGQDVSIQLTIGDEAFRVLLPSIANATDGDLASALALAMPRQPKQVGLRTPSERLAIYRRVWDFYLTHPNAGVEERRVNAAAILKAEGQHALADVERNAPRPHPLLDFTMSGRVMSDGDPLERWRAFRNGAFLLQQALASGAAAETPLDRARRGMQGCWSQVHHLRTIGVFLIDRARIAGVLSKVGRSVTMTPSKAEGAKKALVIVA